MKTSAAIAAALLLASSAKANDDQTHAQFWSKFGPMQTVEQPPASANLRARVAPDRAHVKAIVADEARRQLGERWVNTALRIAYVESRFNANAVGPKTRHGRAQGVMQVMPGSARALGYNPARLREARYGAAAGVSHMRACIASGVRTDREMAACHVAGVKGWKTRLARGHENYKRRYVAMVMR